MDHEIKLHDLSFSLFIDATAIQKRVEKIGKTIALNFEEKNPLFIAILNGSFVFAADLVRACSIDHEITFVKINSYAGTHSTGKIMTHIGLSESIEGRDIIILEDIIDTGTTIVEFLSALKKQNPSSIAIATLLLKPTALEHPLKIDYVGFEIPNRFVVGYGMDYNGLGRNLSGIYQL